MNFNKTTINILSFVISIIIFSLIVLFIDFYYQKESPENNEMENTYILIENIFLAE